MYSMRRLAVVMMVLSMVASATWVGLWILSYSSFQIHARVFSIDEGDEHWFLIKGKLVRRLFTPWDGKWYPETETPLWICVLATLGIGLIALIARVHLGRLARSGSFRSGTRGFPI